MTGASLIAANISRVYDGAPVVDGVDLTLAPGRVTALLGPSGAGKSTLLRILAGLERPDGGEVRMSTAVLSSTRQMVPAEDRRIGLIFQDFALFPHLSAEDNVRFGLDHLPKPDGRALARQWLQRVGLGARAEAYPHQLSGGEQQRVAIARALAPEPIALLMDEPFSGLDPALRQDVRDTAMRAINAVGIPALIVTHDAEEAMLVADEIAIMHAGKIIQQGAPDLLYLQPNSARVAAALGPVNRLTGTGEENGTVATAFGAIPEPSALAGEAYEVIVRPEGLILSEGSGQASEVVSVHRRGMVHQVALKCTEAAAIAWTTDAIPPQRGDMIKVQLNPKLGFVFPRTHES